MLVNSFLQKKITDYVTGYFVLDFSVLSCYT